MVHLESSILVGQEIFDPKDVLPAIEEIVSGEEPDCDEGISKSKDSFVPQSLTKKRVESKETTNAANGDPKVRKMNNPKFD